MACGVRTIKFPLLTNLIELILNCAKICCLIRDCLYKVIRTSRRLKIVANLKVRLSSVLSNEDSTKGFKINYKKCVESIEYVVSPIKGT